jgi:hypothetical protein
MLREPCILTIVAVKVAEFTLQAINTSPVIPEIASTRPGQSARVGPTRTSPDGTSMAITYINAEMSIGSFFNQPAVWTQVFNSTIWCGPSWIAAAPVATQALAAASPDVQKLLNIEAAEASRRSGFESSGRGRSSGLKVVMWLLPSLLVVCGMLRSTLGLPTMLHKTSFDS